MADLRSEREQLAAVEKYFRERDYSQALPAAQKLLNDFPASFHGKLLYARILKETNHVDDAFSTLNSLLRLYPDNINVLCDLGDLYSRQGHYEESLNFFNKVLFLDSFNLQAKEALSRVKQNMEKGVMPQLEDTMAEVTPAELERKVPKTKTQPQSLFFAPVSIDLDTGQTELNKPSKKVETPADFGTESEADLYFQQGFFQEAIHMYDRLYAHSSNDRIRLKREEAFKVWMMEKKEMLVIRLLRFGELIQKRGEEIV